MLGHPWNCTMDGIWKAVYLNFYRQKQPNFFRKTNSIVRNFFFCRFMGSGFLFHISKKRWKGRKTCLTIRALTKWLLEKAFFIFFCKRKRHFLFVLFFFCTSCISFSWINMPEVASSMNWFTTIDKKCIFFLCAPTILQGVFPHFSKVLKPVVIKLLQ